MLFYFALSISMVGATAVPFWWHLRLGMCRNDLWHLTVHALWVFFPVCSAFLPEWKTNTICLLASLSCPWVWMFVCGCLPFDSLLPCNKLATCPWSYKDLARKMCFSLIQTEYYVKSNETTTFKDTLYSTRTNWKGTLHDLHINKHYLNWFTCKNDYSYIFLKT